MGKDTSVSVRTVSAEGGGDGRLARLVLGRDADLELDFAAGSAVRIDL